MSIDISLIGLPQSGKTTIFNALTRGEATIESQTQHIGVVKVPEPRLEKLSDLLHAKHTFPAEIRYLDIGASAKSSGKGMVMSGQLLTELSQVDTLIEVVRAFNDDAIPHIEGSLDVKRDIANVDFELIFSDLSIIERRLEKIEISLKGAKQSERQAFSREQDMLNRMKAELEKNVPLRELEFTAEEKQAIANYQFLSAKPMLIVVNIGEEQLPQASAMEAELISSVSGKNRYVTTLCGKLEMELSQLDDSAAEEFRKDFGLSESGLNQIIKLSYQLLGLISFFTIASEEFRCWSIPEGTDVLKAAGKIHSDMERGFIRAEVVSYNDLLKCGSLAETRKKGVLRLEGKNYTVKDGDIITVLFNV